MAETKVTRQVAAPAEVVYDLVADVTRMGEWSPENQGAEWLDGATGPAVGARFKGRNKRKAAWSSTCVVTEAERGRAFAFDVGTAKRVDTRWRYAIEPTDGGCEVTESFEIVTVPGLAGRLLTKPSTGVSWDERPEQMRQGMEVTLERLAAAAEQLAGPQV
ncbi:MAG TPA: SRPBCC family protein [Acidimicrobiales bacterium]|nr:SRPBCC family protein [Acidimicrobiales bacterium]